MNSLTSYINDQIYPELFNHVNDVFPYMKFVRSVKGWISPYKLDGDLSHDKRNDKSKITYKQPNRVFEQGGDSMDLISFYQFRKSGNLSTIDAVKEIAGILNIDPPKDFDSKSYEEYKKKQNALENVIKRMKEALRSEDGKKTLDYLRNVRGYSDDIINGAEFGYCSSGMVQELRQIFS